MLLYQCLYVYFVLGLISAIWLVIEGLRLDDVAWTWVFIALFIPFISPIYFLQKIRGGQIGRLVIWAILFVVFLVAEAFLISSIFFEEPLREYSKIEKQAFVLLKKLKNNADLLDSQMEELERMSRTGTSKSQILKTIKFISKIQTKTIAAFDKNRKTFVDFTNAYDGKIKKDKLNFIMDFRHYYNCDYDPRNILLLKQYFYTFKKTLIYNAEYIQDIKDRKRQQIQSYDALYVTYRSAVDKYYKSEVQRMEYMREFLKKYPEFGKYLPKKRKLSPLYLWNVK